jgi:transketolase
MRKALGAILLTSNFMTSRVQIRPTNTAATVQSRSCDHDELSVNTIRTLTIDAVQKANSGHPGTPMGMAPVAYTLWQNFLRYDPSEPLWPNRDRFVLSAGHASLLL